MTSQCDSTTASTASLDRNVGPDFYQTTYAHLHTDELLDSDEAGGEEEDNRDADDGAHRDDELLAMLLDPKRNQNLIDDEIQRWASSLYDSEDESAAPSSLPVEDTTPAQQRAETVVNPGAQNKLTAKEYALFAMQHKLKYGLTDQAFNINTTLLQYFFHRWRRQLRRSFLRFVQENTRNGGCHGLHGAFPVSQMLEINQTR